MGGTRPLAELVDSEMLELFRKDILSEPATAVRVGQQQIVMERGELEIERELRARIHNYHLEIFGRTQTETTKRWTYESEVTILFTCV